jgi:hypothetical protein
MNEESAFSQATLSCMDQNLRSRFMPSTKGGRAPTAALAAAPSTVVPIVEVQVLWRERVPVAADSRYRTRGPPGIPEQLEGIGEAHDPS